MASIVEKQVGKVRRRLFLSGLLARLAWCWAGALALAACWFALQPLLVADNPDWLRWAVAGALAGVGTVLAVVLAVRAAPTPTMAALSLDAEFGLKERATTALTLPVEAASTPMGRALVEDAEGKVAPLRVGERFPLRLPRAAALVPMLALALVLLAMFWNPDFSPKAQADEPLPEAKAGIDERMKKLAARVPPRREKGAEAKKEDIERIDAEMEKLARKPRDTREQVRERIKDAQAIEDQIRKEQREREERAAAMKEQMKQLERLTRKDRKAEKGKADPLADAMRNGDLDKAAREMRKLADRIAQEKKKEELKKKIRDPKADAEEKKKAEEELKKLERREKEGEGKQDREAMENALKEMEDQLKELTRDKEDRKKDLEDRKDLDRDQLDREKNELDKNDKLTDEEKKGLLELAKKLGECQQCLKDGDEEGAAKKLKEAGEMAAKMAEKAGENAELAERLKEIQEARKALCRGLGGEGPGAGLRPLGADKGDTDKEEKFSPAATAKGKKEIIGDGPKGGFKGARRPEEMAEEIRQAAQEAPAAIDRQRLPPAARKMARGYFEKVRGQDKDAKKE
ncbi:MAG: hypothetical protein K2W96_15985 [Gemmataceae bacterium]|nr:hypothetical protein [Gemmataceae bacterium]